MSAAVALAVLGELAKRVAGLMTTQKIYIVNQTLY
jgi:hypothetical protein